jgi:signal transduction histidine kinase
VTPVLERIPRRWIDVAIAGVVAFITIGGAFSESPRHLVAVGAAAAASTALLVRRERPLAMLVVASFAYYAAMLADSGAVFPALIVAFYSAAQFLPRRTAFLWGTAAFAGAALAVSIEHFDRSPAALARLAFLAAAWVLGDNARVRRERQEDRARQAVADERARIARELHDVVTHNVSVMVVQAAAGNDVFDERPDQARAALAAIEQTGRQALGELRRLLDVVSDGNAPQPGLAQLDELVDHVRRAGVGVELTVDGTPRELPPALDLSAYRIVQEALTNTLKHAHASRATVRVRYAPGEVDVEVADDGVGAASTGGGRGLVGMHERVKLFGGELRAGPRPGGGFEVRARMPVEAT